ncbi:MAG: hypothetical protein ABI169_01260 [Chitinophagaceae bacterium]
MPSKKWMINSIVGILCLLSIAAEAQIVQVSSGYFDQDNTIDSIFYHFERATTEEPFYSCEMHMGNGKVHKFSIGVAFQSLQISSCGIGCLTTYEWLIGKGGYDEYCYYKYNAACDNWILTSTETTDSDSGKTTTEKAKGSEGINGVDCVLPKATKKKCTKLRQKKGR